MSLSISGLRRTASASAMNNGHLARMFQCVGGNRKAVQAPAPRVQSRTSQAQLPDLAPVQKEFESLEKTSGQQVTAQQVLATALPVGLPTLLGFRAVAKEAGKVVMRDVNELSESCSHPESLSNEVLQPAAGEHGVDSLQIELGKADTCSIGFTDDAAADNCGVLSKDLDISSKSLEAKSVRDSAGSSNEVVLGVEEADTESTGQEGIASMDQEEVHAKDECAGPPANAASYVSEVHWLRLATCVLFREALQQLPTEVLSLNSSVSIDASSVVLHLEKSERLRCRGDDRVLCEACVSKGSAVLLRTSHFGATGCQQ